MDQAEKPVLSVVVPVFNESDGLDEFHRSLIKQLESLRASFEVIYVDDGSTDKTAMLVAGWHKKDPRVILVKLSRNFGKENALAAGVAHARGQASLMIDGDGQHPVELIPEFFKRWREGAQVVIGVRTANSADSRFDRSTSRFFYWLFNRLTGEQIIPRSTDFRLIDRAVRKAFLDLNENDRMTRGLIDWLGFRRQLIEFDAGPRISGEAAYGRKKRFILATNTFVSLTPVPLFLFGYLGIFITIFAVILGGSVVTEQVIFNDPWGWHFTGTAMIGILLMFLIGVVLMALGMLSLYVSHIHSQTKGRPLYVVDYGDSKGVAEVD
jgi:glycosyltransferase involved in cell wall biosynthesis